MLLADIAEHADVATGMTAVADTLRRWIGVGPVFLATADPVTGAFTGTFTFDIPDDAAAAFFDIEMGGADVVSFGSLASSEAAVGSLFSATDGSPVASQRWREVISPLGWGDEMRAAVRQHGAIWGYLCVHREASDHPFAARELDRVRALLPAVAAVMRNAALSTPDDRPPFETGVILVDNRGRLAGATGGAAAWLDELGPPLPGGLPLLLAGLTRLVLGSGRPATSTITTRTNRIGLVDAALLQGIHEQQVAIVISAAPSHYRLDRLAKATGMTTREREILSCVLSGLSTRAIADRLTISPHTVQTHLTSIFAKTRLRSRRELVGRLRQ